MKNIIIKSFVLLLVLMGCYGVAFADMVNKTWTGIAVKGYDVVAYFKDHKAVKGNSSFVFEYNGAKWYFASDANKQVFAKSPTYYAPQYGGFCAFAVSQNHTADIDPQAWTVVNNKLYLNYDASVQSKWNESRDHLITLADQNWPNLNK